MLKIDRQNKNFSLLATPSLASVSITERYDLQEFISNSPKSFFEELGLELFLVGKEVVPSKTVQDRIDLVAFDKEGCCVVIELKRGNNKLQMFQAISYAGMISQWSSGDFLQMLSGEEQEELTDFLEVDIDEINREQKIVLVAESFDYALLTGADWLSDNYSVDIMCCRIAVAQDPDTNSEFLVCSNVYPAPELVKEAGSRGRQNSVGTVAKWSDWDAAIDEIENPIVADFYRDQLEQDRESYLRKRILHYRIDGKRRWFAAARRLSSYVWQSGRFEKDVAFWKQGLSDPASVTPVKDGKSLSYSLTTREDFDFFHNAATAKLLQTEWHAELPDEDLDI
jgi:hypothetical protein